MPCLHRLQPDRCSMELRGDSSVACLANKPNAGACHNETWALCSRVSFEHKGGYQVEGANVPLCRPLVRAGILQSKLPQVPKP